jgi:transposase
MALSVGIDVAKHTLEWNLAGEEKIQHVRNEPRPIAQLVRQLVAFEPSRVVVESTGATSARSSRSSPRPGFRSSS